MMSGPPHHQGGYCLSEYQEVCVSELIFYILYNAKFYNPADPPEAYSNPSVHTCITKYTEMGRALHGETWDSPMCHFLKKPS